jgi:hypothetical protein
MKGGEKVDKEYEETQKEIDKLLLETSQRQMHQKYRDMKKDKDYQTKIKKIGELTLKLEKIQEKNRNN